ncbi:DUF4158 domain-containing protein [Frankia sp. AiPs1]|uniref:DUF4158 domain-containing protein n=1 Tax=Frankia sp. AiPs1 TaxID=573493 RepID=UPI002043D94C|nr:DUF4158 domain-containing protein [Frankia sp. AiPs1]MCM3920399.1 DUF4158 domain-containing protein [Frankia sp. AiPs1]
MARLLDRDELVEHWTLLEDERELIAGRRGPTRLGFTVMVTFFPELGRFPRGRREVTDEAVEYVARQVGVEPGDQLAGAVTAGQAQAWESVLRVPEGQRPVAVGSVAPR